METKITLSAHEFKALASETRTAIIKLLQSRNHTLTELSKKLGMAAPTIKQHLGILESAELVHGIDEGRKWKYYCLTRKGKSIFAGEQPINVLFVLGASAVALVAVVYYFLLFSGVQYSVAGAQLSGGIADFGAQEDCVKAAGAPPGTAAMPANECKCDIQAAGCVQDRNTEKEAAGATGKGETGEAKIQRAGETAFALQICNSGNGALLALLAGAIAVSIVAGFMLGKLKGK